MDALGSGTGSGRGASRLNSTRRAEPRQIPPLSLYSLPPRIEARSHNLPLWMKSAIAYSFSERLRKTSGCEKWARRVPSNRTQLAELDKEVRDAITGFFHPLEGLEKSANLRPLLKIILAGCQEVITQLTTVTIVHQPTLAARKVPDSRVNGERLESLYAATNDPDEKTVIYAILSQVDAEATSENTMLPLNNNRAAFRNAVLAVMNNLENDEGFRDLAHALGFLQYKTSAIVSMEDTAVCVKKYLLPCSDSQKPERSKRELCLRPDWDPVAFMESIADECESDVRELPRLGDTLTLTGSGMLCYANTCRDYAQQFWPRVADPVLSLVDSALAEAFKPKKMPTHFICRRHSLAQLHGEESEPRAHCKIVFSQSHIRIQLEGTVEDIIQTTQMMTWMTASLRLLPEQQSKLVRQCSIKVVEMVSGLLLRPVFNDVDAISRPGLCWISLLPRPVMATGFHIPNRGAEIGLEIPLSIASALIGSSHAAEYRGGVVLKGFSSMIVPERKADDRVQWHVVSSKDEDTPLSYNDGVARCPNRINSSQVDMGSMLASRAFIGWHPNVASNMGRDPSSFDYGSLRDSHARNPNSRVVVEGITVGFQQIATAKINLKLVVPQSPAFFRTRRRRYAGIIRLADNSHVLLYDTAEKRAWLVPASEVILHMAQYRLAQDPTFVNGQPVRLSLSGVASADLISNASVEIEEGYTFQSMVESTWDMLEFLHSDLQTKKIPKPFSMMSPSLLGYEFRHCIEEVSSFNLRQTSLSSGADGWVSLVKDSDNLVLFGRGFGDLMVPQPSVESGICPLWKIMPHGQDLMATPVKVLEQLYDQVPSQGSRRYLSQSKLEWHPGDSQLFEPCYAPLTDCCCQRVQKIASGRYRGCKPPETLAPGGGVIFGDCGKLKRSRPKTKDASIPRARTSWKKSSIREMWSPECSPQLYAETGLEDKIPGLVLDDS